MYIFLSVCVFCVEELYNRGGRPKCGSIPVICIAFQTDFGCSSEFPIKFLSLSLTSHTLSLPPTRYTKNRRSKALISLRANLIWCVPHFIQRDSVNEQWTNKHSWSVRACVRGLRAVIPVHTISTLIDFSTKLFTIFYQPKISLRLNTDKSEKTHELENVCKRNDYIECYENFQQDHSKLINIFIHSFRSNAFELVGWLVGWFRTNELGELMLLNSLHSCEIACDLSCSSIGHEIFVL